MNGVETVKRFEHALPVEPGPFVRISIADTGIGIPGREPRQHLRSLLQHQAERQRPRARDVALDRQEPRGLRRRRIPARPWNDVSRQPARLRRPRRHRDSGMDDGDAGRPPRARSGDGRRTGGQDDRRPDAALPGARSGGDRQRPCRDRAVPSRARTAAAVRRGDARPGHARCHGRPGNDREPRCARSRRQRDRGQRIYPGLGHSQNTGTTASRR